MRVEFSLLIIKCCYLLAKREENMHCSRNKIKDGNGNDYAIDPSMEENNNNQWLL